MPTARDDRSKRRHSGKQLVFRVAAIGLAYFDDDLPALPTPPEAPMTTHALAAEIMKAFPEGAYPHLAELTRDHILAPGYAFANEFFGLELILDGLERALAAQ